MDILYNCQRDVRVACAKHMMHGARTFMDINFGHTEPKNTESGPQAVTALPPFSHRDIKLISPPSQKFSGFELNHVLLNFAHVCRL